MSSRWQCSLCGTVVDDVDLSLGPVRHLCVKAGTPPGPMPGTELKRLLTKVGFATGAGCQCDAHVDEMNRQGVDWCEANIDTIVGWLKKEAEKQGEPYFAWEMRLLVSRAIANARACIHRDT